MLAEALSSKGHQILFATGGIPNPALLSNIKNILQLPPFFVKDEKFDLLTALGTKPDLHYISQRQKLLLDTFKSFKPDLLITEHFPFGRHILKDELIPLLDHAKNNNVKIISSVRDILVSLPAPKIIKIKEILTHYYDAVFIHGDAQCAVFWSMLNDVKPRLFFTGYIYQPTKPNLIHDDLWTQKPVLAFQGGRKTHPNTDSNWIDLLRAIKPKTTFNNNPWIIIGPQNNKYLNEGITIQKSIPNLSQKLNQCAFIISEAGYNSFLEVILSKAPSLFIPFFTPKEDEQLNRLKLFNQTLNLNYLETPFIDANSIQQKINFHPHSSENILNLDTNGLTKTEEIINQLI